MCWRLQAAPELSFLSYTLAGETQAVQSDPVGKDDSQTGGFVRTFVRKPGKACTLSVCYFSCIWQDPVLCNGSGLPLLHQLLNAPLVLKLLKANGTTVIASASLDFGPLAQGLDQFSAESLQLTASESPSLLGPNACLNAKVCFCVTQECDSPHSALAKVAHSKLTRWQRAAADYSMQLCHALRCA